MRGSWVCVLSAVAWLGLAAPQAPRAPLSACGPAAPDGPKYAKPSSFEPHARPPGNVYGTPIGDRILTRPVRKKKPHGSAVAPRALA